MNAFLLGLECGGMYSSCYPTGRADTPLLGNTEVYHRFHPSSVEGYHSGFLNPPATTTIPIYPTTHTDAYVLMQRDQVDSQVCLNNGPLLLFLTVPGGQCDRSENQRGPRALSTSCCPSLSALLHHE